jgi:hypothetical protein
VRGADRSIQTVTGRAIFLDFAFITALFGPMPSLSELRRAPNSRL